MNSDNIYQPYLSIVSTARNDDHGGKMLYRMKLFVNGILAQSAKYSINTELIIVEWNPSSDKPRLAQELSWPKQHNFCTVRIIEVPPEIHKRYQYAEQLPLYQMIAKNVGIRRSHGEFILATNIDLLFSDELFAFFASDKMTKGKLYRINRYDVPPEVPLNASIDEQLSFCKQNVIRISYKNGTINLKTGNYLMINPCDVDSSNGPIDTIYKPLHTNASGDFQLMARENWFIVYGYPEIDIFSLHLDSILCYMAHYSGAVEEILMDPMRLYHIEHGSGWTPEVKRDKSLEKELDSLKIKKLTDEECKQFIINMHQVKHSIIFNDHNWGLAADKLDENTIVRARWDQEPQMIDSNPLVSIITICLNGMPHLKSCIESIHSQDYPNFEYIIQDGGSTDGTVDLLKSYGDRIKWVSMPDSGHGEAMNRALQRCTGEIIGTCNADDELMPNAASWAKENFANNPDCGAIYGDYYEIDDKGKIIQGPLPGPPSFNFERILCVEDVLPMQSAFFRRVALEQAGLFNNPWLPNVCEDFAMWVNLGLVTQIAHQGGVISKYRLHSGSGTWQPESYGKSYIAKREVIERFFLNPDIPSDLSLLRYRALAGLALSIAGMFLMHFGDPKTAMEYIQLARSEQPDIDHLNHIWETIQLWLPAVMQFINNGDRLFSSKNYEKALSVFDSLTALDYWLEGIQYSKAVCLFQLGKKQEAVEALQKELTLHPGFEPARKIMQENRYY